MRSSDKNKILNRRFSTANVYMSLPDEGVELGSPNKTENVTPPPPQQTMDNPTGLSYIQKESVFKAGFSGGVAGGCCGLFTAPTLAGVAAGTASGKAGIIGMTLGGIVGAACCAGCVGACYCYQNHRENKNRATR